MPQCHKCANAIPLGQGEKILLRDTCPNCSADLHVCLNCRFYDPGAHNQCRETQAEWVRYKDEANHCDWFVPLEGVAARGQKPGTDASAAARKKFDNLFK